MSIVWMIVGGVIGWLVGYLIARSMRRKRHWKNWFDMGYSDAMADYPFRFAPGTPWLRAYYDEGYAQGLRDWAARSETKSEEES